MTANNGNKKDERLNGVGPTHNGTPRDPLGPSGDEIDAPEDADEGDEHISLPEGEERPEVRIDEAPERVLELAAACVRFVQSKYGVPLDFTSDTLSLVDQYVREARNPIAQRPESLPLIGAGIGAYLGEVMRRAFDAEWIAEGDHETWRLCFRRVFLSFNPIGMTMDALLSEELVGWHGELSLEEEDRPIVMQRLEQMGAIDSHDYALPSTRYDVVNMVVDALRARMEERRHGDVTFTLDDYT